MGALSLHRARLPQKTCGRHAKVPAEINCIFSVSYVIATSLDARVRRAKTHARGRSRTVELPCGTATGRSGASSGECIAWRRLGPNRRKVSRVVAASNATRWPARFVLVTH